MTGGSFQQSNASDPKGGLYPGKEHSKVARVANLGEHCISRGKTFVTSTCDVAAFCTRREERLFFPRKHPALAHRLLADLQF